jgi:hypothetical protein
MRLIIEHDTKGTITTVAFVGPNANELELEPAKGRGVVYTDTKALGLPDNLEQLRGEELVPHRHALASSFHVEAGNVVRRQK